MAKLDAYRAKRDFKATSEPEGRDDGSSGSAFVVQKHAASRLHYDLRLELDGVMKSWAVAKGPSLVVGEKRLAVHVEDHPIAYNTFEGTIPKGQYGGGTVMIWDRGRWEPEDDPHRGYKKGHLNFRLHGEKLGGAWHLVRMKKRDGERQEPWLLIKAEDEHGRQGDDPDILDEQPLSIATGRTMEAIASKADGAVWDTRKGLAADGRKAKADSGRQKERSSLKRLPSPSRGGSPERSRGRSGGSAGTSDRARPGSPPTPDGATRRLDPRRKREGKTVPFPRAIEPCLARLADSVPGGDRWLHEIKWDGYRLIAFRETARAKGDVKAATRLATRNGHDWTARFPAIAAAINALPGKNAILDGEAVVEDERGISSFSALQNALGNAGKRHGGAGIAHEAIFYAFDLLFLDGVDLRAEPLDTRKTRLAELLARSSDPALRFSEHVEGDGAAMVRGACQLGLEGVISKRRDLPYRSGRGDDWLKTKCTDRQEFVIGGFMPSAVTKNAVGSLALGTYEGDRLVYAGRAGTGYTAEIARSLHRALKPLITKRSPFADRLTADEKRGAVWTEPSLVAEIEFRGWTGDGRARQAAFKGLREDKVATEVVREDRRSDASRSGAKRAEMAQNAPKKRPTSKGDATVAGVALTHPERVLWPDTGTTKLDLARFYEGIADWILPGLVDRPLSLVRCPSGAGSPCFFQKHSWAGLSDHIRRDIVRDEGGEEEVLFIEDLPGLVALVQSGVLEIHPWGTTIADVGKPDRITMDLDPGDGVAWAAVVAGARELKERLAADGLESFVKTTGGKGLHVVVPLDGSRDWKAVKAYSKRLADAMEADAPDRYLAKASKAARRGRIYVDYLRNGRGATAVAAYSTRARSGATCSVPLGWAELASTQPDKYTVANLPGRLGRLKTDPWSGIGDIRQALPSSR